MEDVFYVSLSCSGLSVFCSAHVVWCFISISVRHFLFRWLLNFEFFLYIGVQNVPHVESSESERSYKDSIQDTCESDEDGDGEVQINNQASLS